MSLSHVSTSGENENESSETQDKPKPRESTDTQVGNATASAAAAPGTAPPSTGEPIKVPGVAKNRPARSRAGRNGGNKAGDGKSTSGEGSSEEDAEEEPFRLPENIFNDIVAIATRDAANKAARLVLEDVGFSNHLVTRTADEVMKRCQAAAKADEAERTPTQAAVLETAQVEEIVDAEVVEVIDETSSSKNSSTAETPKKKPDDEGHWVLIAVLVMLGIALIWWGFYPSSPDTASDEQQTTSESDDTETDDTAAVSAARPIASSSSPTPEAIEAFAARVPYSRTERLTALRQLRGTGSEDERDMDCGNTGMNFTTRAFITRTTASGPDTRLLTQAEAQAYFADTSHTGQHTINAVEGQRHYTVYLDLRDRAGEPGHCNFFIN